MQKFIILFTLILVGCASVTPVTPTGADTYMVASHGVVGNGSGANQKVAAIQAAEAYCKARGERMKILQSAQSEPMFGRAPSGQVEFSCTKPDSI